MADPSSSQDASEAKQRREAHESGKGKERPEPSEHEAGGAGLSG